MTITDGHGSKVTIAPCQATTPEEVRVSVVSLAIVGAVTACLVAACAASPGAKPGPTVAPIAPAPSGSAAVGSTALERITAGNVGRLERVRGYEGWIAHVELLRDGTTLVDRFDEIELVDRTEKTLARLPIDARVDPHGRSSKTAAWALSADTGLSIAILRLLPQWSGVVVYKGDGSEEARYALPKIGTAPQILSFTKDHIALSENGQRLVFLDRAKGTLGQDIELTSQVRFRKDGNAVVFDHGSGAAEVKALAAGGLSAPIRYRKKSEFDGSFNASLLSLSDDGRTVIAGDPPDVDVIDLASKKSTKLSANFLGDTWGRADKIAVLGNGGVGLVDRAAPSKVEWKKLPPFPCKGKKTPCGDRDVQWTDLRFPSASAEWPTLFGTAAQSIVVWYPGKRVRVLSPDDHELDGAPIFAADGRHAIELEHGVARVLKVPEPDVEAPTDHWPVVVPNEPDVTRGAFAADGKSVALWNDRTWKAWNLDTGRLIAMKANAKLHVSSGSPVATSDFDDALVREMLLGSDAEIGARQGTLTLRLRTTRDKDRNVVKNTAAELVDVRSEAVLWRANIPAATRVWAIDEGGKHVAASLQASESGFLLFDVAKPSAEPTQVPTGSWVYDLKFFGSRIVSTTNRSEVSGFKDGARWTASTPCTALKESPVLNAGANGTRVIAGFAKRCIFDAETGAFIAEVGTDETGELARLSPDTTELYAYSKGVFSRWDATTGKPLSSSKVTLIDPSGRSRRPIAYTSDGAQIVVAAKDAIVTFDRKTGAEVARTAWPSAMSIAIAPGKERLFAVTDFHGRGAILDATAKERARFFCPDKSGAFNVPEWSADGRSLYCMKTDYYGKPLEAGYVFVVPPVPSGNAR